VNTFKLIKLDGTTEDKPFMLKNGIEYLTDHISRHEVEDRWTKEVVMFGPTLALFEETRRLLGKPIGINSGYRSPDYQKHLKEIGYKAATDSPHCRGAALDLTIPYGTTYLALISLIRQAAKNLGLPKPRLGYKEYGYTFVHVDLVFMLFEPYMNEVNPHPQAWAKGVEW
jgi:uncharacterized protein YcbK (DUF882 family)